MPIQYFKNEALQIKDFLRSHRNIKVRFVLVCLMEKQQIDERKTIISQDKAYIQSKTYNNLEAADVKEILSKMINKILNKISSYQRNGSGWYFKEILKLEIHPVDYKPMRGSSYIPLPAFILRKKAIVNIQNKDQKCFLWSVLRYLHPADKNETVLKQYENELNMNDIDFPVKLKDITKFENQNPSLPEINVFSINENNRFYPLRIKKRLSKIN